ncbi:hypothetical protein COLO4_04718 [Corchorus olitorius]|uniref:Uncharacterized protein n=1 Tax=Corchorus olitorius TaxID=93759 RepID=A0A1R3KT10_9ROSI|nr:hypothetical protein COLO4_04718 [Corchorus olitorius]
MSRVSRLILLPRSLCASFPVAFKVQTSSSPHKFLVNPSSGLVHRTLLCKSSLNPKTKSHPPTHFPSLSFRPFPHPDHPVRPRLGPAHSLRLGQHMALNSTH